MRPRERYEIIYIVYIHQTFKFGEFKLLLIIFKLFTMISQGSEAPRKLQVHPGVCAPKRRRAPPGGDLHVAPAHRRAGTDSRAGAGEILLIFLVECGSQSYQVILVDT